MNKNMDERKVPHEPYDTASCDSHGHLIPKRTWRNIASQKRVLLKCNVCNKEKEVNVGAGWNPELVGGMVSSCKGTCDAGKSGTFHIFIKFVDRLPPQNTPKQ